MISFLMTSIWDSGGAEVYEFGIVGMLHIAFGMLLLVFQGGYSEYHMIIF